MKLKKYLLPLAMCVALPALADSRLSCTDTTEAEKARSQVSAYISFAAECRYRGSLDQAYRAMRAHPKYGAVDTDLEALVPAGLPSGNYTRRTDQKEDEGDQITIRRQGRNKVVLKVESLLNGAHQTTVFERRGGTVVIRTIAKAP